MELQSIPPTAEIDASVILANIAQANTAYQLSKDSAARAAAYAYIVWRDTMADGASQEARNWFIEQVRTRNDEIRAHNEDEETLRQRVDAFKKGKLHELNRDDLALQESEDASELVLIIRERNRLKKLGELSTRAWEARKKILIEAREGSSEFTVITKFVFQFHLASDSDVSSRYAQVLAWIHGKFAGKTIEDVSDIVDTIQAEGGFERVLHEQRNKPVSKIKVEDDIDGAERKAMAEHILAKMTSALKQAPTKATIDVAARHGDDGLVVLVGRPNGSQIEIIEEMALDKKARDEVIAAYEDEQAMPMQPATEFIGRVLSLGQLISVDEETGKTEFDLAAGEPVKIERTLTLLPSDQADFVLVASARHADACAIVKAFPRHEGVKLGKVAAPVFLPGSKVALLSKMTGERQGRRVFQFAGEANGAGLVWTVDNTALDPLNKASKSRRKFVWADLANELVTPLDVVGCNPLFCGVVSMEHLKLEYKAKFGSEGTYSKAKKKPEKIDLTFHGVTVIKTAEGKFDVEKIRGAKPTGKASLTFRLSDLQAFHTVLTQQKTTEFVFAADTGGLLVAYFSDELADYEVYLPTATADGKRLQNRRIEPMRLGIVAQEAQDAQDAQDAEEELVA